jgi:site-specific DNA-methyltransferase (adenine-specific)
MISHVENCDCMDFMKGFPDKFFDLAIVDPPYGIKQDGHRENNRSKLAISKNYHKALWDQDPPDAEYFNELFRVSKNQIIWGANNYPQYLRSSPCWIVWDKDNSGNFADCELAYTSFVTAVRKIEIRWNGMLQHNMKNKEERIHPTQKPAKLYNLLLENYANENDKILDTHLGSGSSRIAAYKLGFDFWGCEIDKDYFEAQEKRFKEAINEPLFQTQPERIQAKLL